MEPIVLESGIIEVSFGENVKVVTPVNLYGCEIGDDCFVGPFVEVQRDVVIGSGTRIQSHSFICEGVRIGRNCFVGHGVMFINDKFSTGGPAQGNKDLWEKTVVGDNVSLGSNVTMLPVRIADNCVIGAGSVVVKDILEHGIYAGNPARKIRDL